MGSQEFDIVRDLIDNRWQPQQENGHALQLAPASFREIDGRELARQYVAHRRLLEASRSEPGAPVRPVLRATRSDPTTSVTAPEAAQNGAEGGGGIVSGWFSRLRAPFAPIRPGRSLEPYSTNGNAAKRPK